MNKYRIIFSTRPMLVCVGIYHATRKYKIKESPKKCSIILKNRNNQDLICSMSSCRIFFFIEVELKTAVFRDFDFIFFKVKKMFKLHLNFKITHSESTLVYTMFSRQCQVFHFRTYPEFETLFRFRDKTHFSVFEYNPPFRT